MSKHNLIPWHVTEAGYIGSNGEGFVPLVSPFREGANKEKDGGPTEQAKANADFIVRAVNSHDDLLAAAKLANKRFGEQAATGRMLSIDDWREVQQMLSDAILKAEDS